MKQKMLIHRYFNIKQSTKRAILEFNLDDPYSEESFLNALKADKMAYKLNDFYDQVARPVRKYGCLKGWETPLTNDQIKVLDHFITNCLEYINDEDL